MVAVDAVRPGAASGGNGEEEFEDLVVGCILFSSLVATFPERCSW